MAGQIKYSSENFLYRHQECHNLFAILAPMPSSRALDQHLEDFFKETAYGDNRFG